MAIEFVVFLEDDATEEEQKAIAVELSLLPVVIGVYRQAKSNPGDRRITHNAPGATQ